MPTISTLLEAAPGCPIPNLRNSRPRKVDTGASTELPGSSAEVTQTSSKESNTDQPDSANANGDLSEYTGGREVVRHSRYIDFDPYAWTDVKKFDPNAHANAQPHTEHTIHRRKARSRNRRQPSKKSGIHRQ